MAPRGIERYTLAELKTEIAKRATPQAGTDWYYIVDQFDDQDIFLIVHKRYWHRHHYVKDCRLSRFLTLPPGFMMGGGSPVDSQS